MEDPENETGYRAECHRLRVENARLRAEETQMRQKYASLQRRYSKLLNSYKDIVSHWKAFKKRAGGSKDKYNALIREEMPEARHSIAEYKKEQDAFDSEASKLYDEFKKYQTNKLAQ